MTNTNDEDLSNQLVLYVKAGSDGVRFGACPFCQRALMVLMSKSLNHSFHYRSIAVNLAKPPDSFRKYGIRRVPALQDGDQIVDNIDDIVTYLEEKFPDSHLQYNNAAADLAVKDLFSRFCFFIKQVSKDSQQLENELHALDNFLGSQGSTYLCGDRLSHLDLEVLPKLHHIRVASADLKHFAIPTHLTRVWAYLFAAYNCDVFVQTCPSDQEILLHWQDRPQLGHMSYEAHKKLINAPPKYSFDVPVHANLVTLN